MTKMYHTALTTDQHFPFIYRYIYYYTYTGHGGLSRSLGYYHGLSDPIIESTVIVY